MPFSNSDNGTEFESILFAILNNPSYNESNVLLYSLIALSTTLLPVFAFGLDSFIISKSVINGIAFLSHSSQISLDVL